MALVINGKEVPEVALGTWAWGKGINGSKMIFGTHTTEEELVKVFQCAMENHLNLWDTAAVYGMGEAEQILGRCVVGKDVILSTKYTPSRRYSSKEIDRGVEASKKRLGGKMPDIYWLHMPENIQENLSHMIELLKKKVIGSIGVSNFNLEQIVFAESVLSKEGYHIGAVQNHYSLLYRGSEKAGIISWCHEKNIPFFAYMVLEQGALTGRFNQDKGFPLISRRQLAFPKKTLARLTPLHKALKEVGDKYEVSIATTALAWAIAKGTIPLVGVTKTYQVEELIKLKHIQLLGEEIIYLEQIAKQTGVEVVAGWEKKIDDKVE